MLCSVCLSDTVSWRGPITALTHTECSKCGGIDCQIVDPESEGNPCPRCSTPVEYEPVDNCSCHISPPCGACVSARLICTECQEYFE